MIGEDTAKETAVNEADGDTELDLHIGEAIMPKPNETS